MDSGETVEQALTRELWEEIGLDPVDFQIVGKRGGYRYLFSNGRRRGHDGKEQTYFLCDFVAEDSKINVNTEHPEFRAWKWVEPGEFRKDWLPDMKVEVYAAVFWDFFKVRL